MGAGASALSVESPDADIKAAYEGASADERSAFLVKVGDQEKMKLASLGLDVSKAAQSGNESFPSHPSSSQTARGPDEVTASLAALGLDRYAPAFRELGYDDLDYLKRQSQEKLLQVAKRVHMLEGHAVRWVESLSGTAASFETVALAFSAPGAAEQVRDLPVQAPPNDDEEGERSIVLWFIKADKLRGCDDRVLPRFQDLQRQRPDWFVEKEITLEGACAHEYADEVLAVSHRWEQPAEPDTEGKQFAAICVYVRGKPAIKLVWVDFSCAPQKERTPAEELVFGRTLRFISLLFLGSRVLILCDRTYTTRFWTLFEAWISMQMATDDGLVPAPREKRRCDIVPIHLASSVTASELETLVAGKSLDQVYAMLGSPDIQVTNQKDKGMQLAKLLALDHQVRLVVRKTAPPTLTLAGGAPRPSGGGAGAGTGADAPAAPSKDERLQRLVEQVRSGSADAAGALADMGDDESRVAIASAGGIVPLVALLTAQDPAAGAEAARALRSLAWNDENAVLIAQAGAIAPLVTLVQSGTDDQKEHAAGALANLACNAENRVPIAQAGAIAPLVTLVQSGTANQKNNAAVALKNLAFSDENEVWIVQAGAIAPLVTLVQSGTDRQKESAAGALWNLAANAENKVLIAQAGAIAPLVTLMQSGTAGQKESAAGALRNLAANAENKVLIAQAGAIAPLVTLVQSGTAGQKENAAGALRNLAANAENQVLIAQAGAIAPLVTLVQSGTAGQKENAAGALRNLAANAENKVLIAQAGAITPLVTLVQSGTDGQKEQAAAALGNLANNAENQVLIAQAGAIAPLVALVQSGTAGQKEQAAGALRFLAVNAENQVLIAKAGAIAPLVTLVQSGTAGQKERAAGALKNLAVNAENQVLIAQAGGSSRVPCAPATSPARVARSSGACLVS
jgi:vacuolar protein 8